MHTCSKQTHTFASLAQRWKARGLFWVELFQGSTLFQRRCLGSWDCFFQLLDLFWIFFQISPTCLARQKYNSPHSPCTNHTILVTCFLAFISFFLSSNAAEKVERYSFLVGGFMSMILYIFTLAFCFWNFRVHFKVPYDSLLASLCVCGGDCYQFSQCAQCNNAWLNLSVRVACHHSSS